MNDFDQWLSIQTEGLTLEDKIAFYKESISILQTNIKMARGKWWAIQDTLCIGILNVPIDCTCDSTCDCKSKPEQLHNWYRKNYPSTLWDYNELTTGKSKETTQTTKSTTTLTTNSGRNEPKKYSSDPE